MLVVIQGLKLDNNLNCSLSDSSASLAPGNCLLLLISGI